jgi:acyl carrier protein
MNAALSTPDLANELEQFVRSNYHVRADDQRFSREVDLWEEGYVDSTGVIEIIAFLEQRLNFMLPESVLFSPRFRSVNGITQLVLEL